MSVIGEEAIADSAAQAVSGLRDLPPAGEISVKADFGAWVEQQARAARSAARIGSVRSLCIASGSWLPLVIEQAAALEDVGRCAPAPIIGDSRTSAGLRSL